MQTLLSFLFVIGILVLIHELGHFIVARWAKVRVEDFAFGFGWSIWKKKIKDTTYRINIFPLGGYVKLAGEDTFTGKEDEFYSRPPYQRIAILLSGSFSNFILAVIIFCFAGMIVGIPTEKVSNTVWRILPSSPAEKIGLKPKDEILKINGIEIKDGKDMVNIIHQSAEKKLTLVIKRKGRTITKEVTPRQGTLPDGREVGLIGFNPMPVMKKVGFTTSVSLGLKQTYEWTRLIFSGLRSVFVKLFRGKVPEEVGGPIIIAKMSGQFAEFGLGSLLIFVAILSIHLGIINLFPFPALDGGRLIFQLVEVVIRKRVDVKFENAIHLAGFIFLMALMILIAYSDVLKISQGKIFPK